MTIGRESIPVDQRVIFWKVEDPRPRITRLSNLCQGHATSGMGILYLGLRRDASDFHPAEAEVK